MSRLVVPCKNKRYYVVSRKFLASEELARRSARNRGWVRRAFEYEQEYEYEYD
jgi:hypothetical protein